MNSFSLYRYKHHLSFLGSCCFAAYFIHFHAEPLVQVSSKLAQLLLLLQHQTPGFVLAHASISFLTLALMLASPNLYARAYFISLGTIALFESLLHPILLMIIWLLIYAAVIAMLEFISLESTMSQLIWLKETHSLYQVLVMLITY